MKRIDTAILVGVFGMMALYFILGSTVGVSFYRAVPLANDPLTNSVAVTSISTNRLTLEDGRVLIMDLYAPESLEQAVSDSGWRVELADLSSGLATVAVKHKRFTCGTHKPRIVIPLVQHGYPAYERQLLGFGTLQ